MSNLKTLILQGNAITHLPKNLGNLSQLTILDLSNNFLSQLPDSLDCLESLQVLNLKDNQFANIPTTIGALSNLRQLNFENSTPKTGQGNNLTAIPVELFSLSNLEILDLNQNNILFLPEKVVSNWNKLHTLNIRNNRLSALPKNIGDLQSLRVIDAQENQILFIPASILKLKASLQHCFLNNNLLHNNPLQVQAILILMGTPLDQIKCLLELQTPTEITPMCMEDGTALEDDSDLAYITQDFKKYIDDLAQRQYLGFLFDMKQKEMQAAGYLNARSVLPEVTRDPLGY